MPEQVHPLATEAARLGVSSSTLSEAVSKGRRCAGRDVLSRARFDARSGRCIGFVPAGPETYYHNGVPAPVPLTKEEADAVAAGDLTPEEAETEARARVEGEEPEPTPRAAARPVRQSEPAAASGDELTAEELVEKRAAELAASTLGERAAERRAAELVAEVEGDEAPEPDGEAEEDPYEQASAWFVELSDGERRAFIMEHGEEQIEEAVSEAADEIEAEIERRAQARAFEIANDVLTDHGLGSIASAVVDGVEVFRNGPDDEADDDDEPTEVEVTADDDSEEWTTGEKTLATVGGVGIGLMLLNAMGSKRAA